jgi:hypothetical protein
MQVFDWVSAKRPIIYAFWNFSKKWKLVTRQKESFGIQAKNISSGRSTRNVFRPIISDTYNNVVCWKSGSPLMNRLLQDSKCTSKTRFLYSASTEYNSSRDYKRVRTRLGYSTVTKNKTSSSWSVELWTSKSMWDLFCSKHLIQLQKSHYDWNCTLSHNTLIMFVRTTAFLVWSWLMWIMSTVPIELLYHTGEIPHRQTVYAVTLDLAM